MPRVWLPLGLLIWTVLVWINYWPAFRFPPEWLVNFVWPSGYELDGAHLLRAISSRLRIILAVLLLILAFNRGGRKCCIWIGLKGSFLFASLPVGLFLAGMVGLGLGLAGLFFPSILLACLAAGILAGYPGNLRLGRFVRPGPSGLLAALVSLTALAGALAPEITYDALAYHLGAPEKFLATHRIIRLDHMLFTDFPLGLQMVYSFACALAGEGAAKLLHWALGAACMAQAALAARKLFGREISVWSLSFLAATPFLATQMTRTNVDLGVMFFTGAALYRLLKGSKAGLVAGGMFMGAAAAVKLTGIYGLLAAAMVFGLPSLRRMTAVILPAGIALFPWLARGYLFTGSPVYPFLSDWFGGVGWTSENQAIYRMDMTAPSSFAIQYPLVLDRLAGFWLHIQHDRGGGAAFGPFALTLLPAALFMRLSDRVRRIGLFCLAYWLFWFVTARDGRFFLPAWPAVCIFSAALMAEMKSSGIRVPLLRPAFIAALAVAPFMAAVQIYKTQNPAPVLFGAVSGREYRDGLIPPPGKYLPLMRFAAGQALNAGNILIVGDVKAPQAAHRAIYASMLDTPHIVKWVRESSSSGRLAVKFKQRRIAVIFYNVAGAAYLHNRFGQYAFEDAQAEILGEFWEKRLLPLGEIREDGRVLIGVYGLLEKPGPPRAIPLPGEVGE